MKILLVTSDLSDGGGVNRVISNLTEIFASFPGLHVDVLHAKPFAGFRFPMPAGVNIVTAQRIVGTSSALNLLLNLLVLRRRGYDHVLSFWTQENIVTAIAFFGSGSRRILCEHFCHDQSVDWIRKLRIWTYRTAHRVLVLNSEELAYYRAVGVNAMLLANPVARSTVIRRAAPSKQNLIIGVGHLIPRKGFSYLVRACVKADVAAAGWRVVIIGDGPERESLQRLIDEHRASGYIELAPSTPAIDDWYRAARVVVVPSISEVFSMVIPEAMAHAVVPIAFATDGPKDILDGWPHNLVPIRDVEALAAALARVIRDPDLNSQASQMRQEAFARYSFDTISAQWKGLLAP